MSAKRNRIGSRRLDAVLLLDKRVGISSNAALQEAKRLFRAAKAGHSGTLDPLASGLLPVLFGEATKFSRFLLDSDKEYLARVQLGVTTTTGDAEGEVTQRCRVALVDGAIEAALARFRGESTQVPPMYSALKRNGHPLYKLARQGAVVAREPRRVVIRTLEYRGRTGDVLELRVFCSKGTYLRTLAEDLGTVLGTGAHLAALRRTAAGPFTVEQAVALESLVTMDEESRDKALIPIDGLLESLPLVRLDAAGARSFSNGRPVPHPPAEQGRCRVYGDVGVLLGVGEVNAAGELRPVRLLAGLPGVAQAAEIPGKNL